MRKDEPKIKLLIKFLCASDGDFLEMDHTIDHITEIYLRRVYENYEKILKETENETNQEEIASAFEKMYDVVEIEGFNSKLYYDLRDYIWNLRHSNMDICRMRLNDPDFVADMRRVKVLLNQYRGE